MVPRGDPAIASLTIGLTDAGQVFDALSAYAGLDEPEPGIVVPRSDAVVHFSAIPAILVRPVKEDRELAPEQVAALDQANWVLLHTVQSLLGHVTSNFGASAAVQLTGENSATVHVALRRRHIADLKAIDDALECAVRSLAPEVDRRS